MLKFFFNISLKISRKSEMIFHFSGNCANILYENSLILYNGLIRYILGLLINALEVQNFFLLSFFQILIRFKISIKTYNLHPAKFFMPAERNFRKIYFFFTENVSFMFGNKFIFTPVCRNLVSTNVSYVKCHINWFP